MFNKFTTAGISHPAQGSATFNGSSDYIQLNDPFSYTNHTIAAWVYVEANSSSKEFFDALDADNDGIRFLSKSDEFIRYSVNAADVDSSTSYTNEWVYAVGTYDGTTQKLYINGSLDDSQSTSQTISTTTDAVIGARSFSTKSNMALIDKASLLMVPSTYEAGTLYNVLPSGNRAPDSTDQNSGYDQTRADFTFDRGSNAAATRVNSDGLIEKYRENLLTYSNDFSNAVWTKADTSVTSGQADKDGGTDAWLLSITGASGFQTLRQTKSVSGVNTISIYAKANALNWMRITNGISSTYFDIANGVVGTDSSIGASIESAGNGLATDYLDSGATTAKAGVLIDLPRINYDANGENGALLLEPSRQQLITQSEYFGSYTPLSATITDNAATSPEGLVNAASFIETTASGRHRTQTNSFSVTSGSTYTLSIFAKIASGSRLLCLNADYIFNARAYFDLVNGDVEGTDSGSASIEDYGNGWYRCSITGTSSITGSSLAYFGLEDGASDNGYTGDGTSGHYWYGLQAEAGSYPTSYIPNHGTSGGVTRAAEKLEVTGANGTAFKDMTSGTLLMDFEFNKEVTADALTWRSSGSALGRGYLYDVRMGMADSYGINITLTEGTRQKCIWRLNSLSNATVFANGTKGATNSGNTWNDIDTITLLGSRWNFKINSIQVFNEALTDAECITLTTL